MLPNAASAFCTASAASALLVTSSFRASARPSLAGGQVLNLGGIARSDDGAKTAIEHEVGKFTAEAGGTSGNEPYVGIL